MESEQKVLSLLRQREDAVNIAKETGDYTAADKIKRQLKQIRVETYDTKDALGNKSTEYHIRGDKMNPGGIHGIYVWTRTVKS